MSVSLDLRVTTSTQDGTTTSMDVGDEGEASAGEDLHYKTTESLMRITRAVVSPHYQSANVNVVLVQTSQPLRVNHFRFRLIALSQHARIFFSLT